MILRSDAVSLCDEVKNVMMILPNVDDVSASSPFLESREGARNSRAKAEN